MKNPFIKQITKVEYNKDDNDMNVSSLGAHKILDVEFIQKYFEQACLFSEDEAKAEAAKFVWCNTNGKVTANYNDDHIAWTFHQDQERYLHTINLPPEGRQMLEESIKSHYEAVFDEEQRKLFERGLAILHAMYPDNEELHLLHDMIRDLPKDNQEVGIFNRITHGLCM